MAITTFQKEICRLISSNRIEKGESYVAGGVALNTLIEAPRISRDIDLFHDTHEALETTLDSDKKLLQASNYNIEFIRERASYVEAIVRKKDENVLMQWTCDSAFRFFPLLKNDEFGMTLHPFDLATNKVLALVGRLEIRDWVDMIHCHQRIQKIGYLMWAACQKDPGLNPLLILEEAKRSSHYSAEELNELSFEGNIPDISKLSIEWKLMLNEAGSLLTLLPSEDAGKCVLSMANNLYRGTPDQLNFDLKQEKIHFHCGSIRGAFPEILKR